ncbi:UvrY/SirA/GacA family response regulator transcription factor [Gayadomonas joobiniege]|uniref:UvrY/SirA/GacA family response regulator transcription factor n=1 Tax=Gayadomonas joobiniege TaxID=1234606 RepID=UPI0003690690|nr:UvrY/SirA/GacA family response regulator transcription factor [Gayadomonas joobiniege]
MIKILLVDDHIMVSSGMGRILNDERGFSVLATVGSGEEAVQFCRKHNPDIVLMDIHMPGIGGMEATKKILRYCPDTRVIVVSVHTENPMPAKVMQLGASGFLSKDALPEEVIKAIRKVHSGQRYLSTKIAQQMALAEIDESQQNPYQVLSDRELQIMNMITRGKRVQDISEQLSLSSKTVNSYRYRMFEKLQISGDVELTHLAIKYRMLDMNDL